MRKTTETEKINARLRRKTYGLEHPDNFETFCTVQNSHRQFAKPSALDLALDRFRLVRCIVVAFDSMNGERLRFLL